jgi:hypothetical protein
MHTRLGITAVLAVFVTAAPALAGSYPVSGNWTYNYSPEKGPAKQCGDKHMEFRGERRFDTGGGVPDYRNISVTPAGSSEYRIVDEVFNGPQHGHMSFTLKLIDNDHIELALASGGNIRLRRCG